MKNTGKPLSILIAIIVLSVVFSGCIFAPEEPIQEQPKTPIISISIPDVYINTGESGEIIAYVNNTGNGEVKGAGIEVSGLDDFDVVIPSSDNIYPLDSLRFKISITARETNDKDYKANITLASSDYRKSVTVTVHLLAPKLSVTTQDALVLNSSEKRTLSVEVANGGRGIARNVRADITGLPVNFTKIIPSQQDIGPKETKTFNISLTAPKVDDNVDYGVSIEAKNDKVSAAKNITVSVSLLKVVKLSIGEIGESRLSLGETKSVNVTVSNNGNTDASDVVLTVSNTGHLQINSVTPATQTIPRGGTRIFTLNITAPSDTTENTTISANASCPDTSDSKNSIVRTAFWTNEPKTGEKYTYSLYQMIAGEAWEGNYSIETIGTSNVRSGFWDNHTAINYSFLIDEASKTGNASVVRKINGYEDATTHEILLAEETYNSTENKNTTTIEYRYSPDISSNELEYLISRDGLYVGENLSNEHYSVAVVGITVVTTSIGTFKTAAVSTFNKHDNSTSTSYVASNVGEIKREEKNSTGAITEILNLSAIREGTTSITTECHSSHVTAVNKDVDIVETSQYPSNGARTTAFKPASSLAEVAEISKANTTVIQYLSGSPNAIVSTAFYYESSETWEIYWESNTNEKYLDVSVNGKNKKVTSVAEKKKTANWTELSDTQPKGVVTESSAIYLAEHESLFTAYTSSRYGLYCLMYSARTKGEQTETTFSEIDTDVALWVMLRSVDDEYSTFDAFLYINAENGKVLKTVTINRHLQINGPVFADMSNYTQKNARFFANSSVAIHYEASNLKATLQSGKYQLKYQEYVKIYDSTDTLILNKTYLRDLTDLTAIPAFRSSVEVLDTAGYVPGKYRAEITVEDILDDASRTSTDYFYILSDTNIDKSWSTPIPMTDYLSDGEASHPNIMQDSAGKFWIAFSWFWYSWFDSDMGYLAYALYDMSLIGTVNSTAPTSTWNDTEANVVIQEDTRFMYTSQPSLIQDKNNTYLMAVTCWNNGTDDIWNTNGTGDIWASKSNDCTNWNATQVTNNSINDEQPSLMQDSNGTYWLTWTSCSTDNYDVFLSNSVNGINWSTPIKMSTCSQNDTAPRIIQSNDGKLVLYWVNQGKTIYRASVDNGTTWSAPAIMFEHALEIEDVTMVQANDGKFYMVFEGYNSTYDEYNLFATNSSDLSNWEQPKQITKSHSEAHPCLTQDKNGKLWLVWASYRQIITSEFSHYEIWLAYTA